MAEKITVPTLGESVTEATVSKWLKNQGEKVVADEPIVELETDKVNVEVPSPISGILGNITTTGNTYKVQAAAPSSPTNGMLWWDSDDYEMKVYNGNSSSFVPAG